MVNCMDAKEICFKQDTKKRKQFFKASSFTHPAKMVLGLQIYLIEHYTKQGDTILDPMAGSGTVLMACTLGRNVVLVELEDKYIKMLQDNYKKIRSIGPMLGFTMGKATILQGDARNLDGLLADNILFSPPYALSQCDTEGKETITNKYPELKGKGGGIIAGTYKGQRGKNNISALPYGEISAVIKNNVDVVCTSPPYAESQIGDNRKTHNLTIQGINKNGKPRGGSLKSKFTAKADAVITSPPYSESGSDQSSSKVYTKWCKQHGRNPESPSALAKSENSYAPSTENIGNLKSENYLQAMLQVYRQCHRVLKEKGLMVLVVKNFIRDKKIVRLDLDTIRLCKKNGFTLIERLKRKIISQSFWRTLYRKKYPEVPPIKYEDVLVFQREEIKR